MNQVMRPLQLMPSLRLNNGTWIPDFGLGLYKMTSKEMSEVLPTYAEHVELMHIDGATVYENQAAFAQCWKQLQLPRSRLFITDKLWDTEHANVRSACEGALKRLGLDYLDLYLVHWPFSMKPDRDDPLSAERDVHGKPVKMPNVTLRDVWRQMEGLVDHGLVKSIGLSNFTLNQLKDILVECKRKPQVLQIEVHPWLPQRELVSFCEQEHVIVEAYAPLGTSLLLSDDTVVKISKEVGHTPAQVLLSFGRQRGLVVLCKTGSPAHLLDNMKYVALSQDHVDRLFRLENGTRLFQPKEWYGEEYANWP